jgi:hypothetical protein
MNLKQMAYLLVCGAALLYLVTANARGYVPFSGPPAGNSGGGNGGFGHGGGYFFFHK